MPIREQTLRMMGLSAKRIRAVAGGKPRVIGWLTPGERPTQSIIYPNGVAEQESSAPSGQVSVGNPDPGAARHWRTSPRRNHTSTPTFGLSFRATQMAWRRIFPGEHDANMGQASIICSPRPEYSIPDAGKGEV